MAGSDKPFWRSRLTFSRRTAAGIDPTTQLPTTGTELVLENEPCDLYITKRRVGQQGPNGTVYNTVKSPVLRIHPDDPADVPDENDDITVDGTKYRVLSSTPNYDAGDGRYMGSLLEVQSVVSPDARPG